MAQGRGGAPWAALRAVLATNVKPPRARPALVHGEGLCDGSLGAEP